MKEHNSASASRRACDVCGKSIKTGDYGCQVCGYDKCKGCHGGGNFYGVVTTCSEKHKLTDAKPEHWCDLCCQQLGPGGKGCRTCNWDICKQCNNKNTLANMKKRADSKIVGK